MRFTFSYWGWGVGGWSSQNELLVHKYVLFFAPFPKGSHHGRKAAFLWSFAARGGGGSDQFRTFWGDFGMCVEITNILYFVLKHLI